MFIVETKRSEPVPIEDLGISVSRAKSEIITPEQKAKSICLANLIRKGYVQVSTITRSRQEKAPPPPVKKAKPLPPQLTSRQPKVPQGSGKVPPRPVQASRDTPATAPSPKAEKPPEVPPGRGRGGRRKVEPPNPE